MKLLRRLLDEPLPPPELSPESSVTQQQEAMRVHRCLDRLDYKYREALVLGDMEGLPVREIAAALSLPVETVRTRMKRARVQFERSWSRSAREDEPR